MHEARSCGDDGGAKRKRGGTPKMTSPIQNCTLSVLTQLEVFHDALDALSSAAAEGQLSDLAEMSTTKLLKAAALQLEIASDFIFLEIKRHGYVPTLR